MKLFHIVETDLWQELCRRFICGAGRTPLAKVAFHFRPHRINTLQRVALSEKQTNILLPILMDGNLLDNMVEQARRDEDHAIIIAHKNVPWTNKYAGTTDGNIKINVKECATRADRAQTKDGDLLVRHVGSI